eukprot:3259250-Rhodomonas_salina.1
MFDTGLAPYQNLSVYPGYPGTTGMLFHCSIWNGKGWFVSPRQLPEFPDVKRLPSGHVPKSDDRIRSPDSYPGWLVAPGSIIARQVPAVQVWCTVSESAAHTLRLSPTPCLFSSHARS